MEGKAFPPKEFTAAKVNYLRLLDKYRYTICVETDDYRALGNFRYQIRKFLHLSEEAARREGLEPQQHQMLLAIRALNDDGPPTVGQLAGHL